METVRNSKLRKLRNFEILVGNLRKKSSRKEMFITWSILNIFNSNFLQHSTQGKVLLDFKSKLKLDIKPMRIKHYSYGSKIGNTLLTRFRTGRTSLNLHRFTIGQVEEPTCICHFEEESSLHLILDCFSYTAERQTLFSLKINSKNILFSELNSFDAPLTPYMYPFFIKGFRQLYKGKWPHILLLLSFFTDRSNQPTNFPSWIIKATHLVVISSCMVSILSQVTHAGHA